MLFNEAQERWEWNAHKITAENLKGRGNLRDQGVERKIRIGLKEI
jgi:hypothetical protein